MCETAAGCEQLKQASLRTNGLDFPFSPMVFLVHSDL